MSAVEGMKGKCARCHRPMTIRKEGQRFGPKCCKKERNNHIEVKSTKGEVLAVIL